MAPKEYALIVAGGKGTRIKSDLPKQFMALNGKPVLLHTIDAFVHHSENISIVLVLPENDFEIWEGIRLEYNFTVPVLLQAGGSTRFQSVRNGLSKIEGDGLVAIHDGVRPLVTTNIISDSFKFAAVHHSAIAAVPLKESIRMTGQKATRSMDRTQFRLIQTPQTFDLKLIKAAYQTNEDFDLTDDASVAERAGNPIFLFDGSYENIKITTPEDFVVAEALMKMRSESTAN